MRARSAHAKEVLVLLVEAEPDLARVGAASLIELFGALDRRGPAGGDSSGRIARALLRQFLSDELVGLGLLAALVPGLSTVGRALAWGKDGPWDGAEEFGAALVATAWTVLASFGGQSIDYAFRRVLQRVQRVLADERRAAQDERRRCGLLLDFDVEDPSPISVLEELTIALRHLLGGEIPAENLRLLFANRVLGYSLTEVAAATGERMESLRYRRKHVEAVLGAA